MTSFHYKILVAAGTTILLASVFAAGFFTQPALCFLPMALLALFFFLQYPGALFYVLLASIPWSTEVNFSGGLGTDLPDEPLMLLLAFAALAIIFFRRRNGAKAGALHTLLLLLFLALAWSVVTIAMSTSLLHSTKYFLAKGWYVLAFVGAPLLLKGDEKFIKRSAVVLFSSMFVVTCIALIKHASLHFTFAKVNGALAPFFRNHVNYSALLVFMVPLQIAFYRLAKNGQVRTAILFSFFIVLAALILSYSRGAWLACLIGLAAYWLIKKSWLLKSFLFAIVLVSAAAFWLQHNDNYLRFAPEHNTTIFHTNFSEHLIATYKGKDVSTAERFYRWVAGARMSKEKWLTGFGPTTFTQEYKPYAIPLFRTWVSDNKEQSTVHNYFLLLLIEQGVFGLLLFLLLLGGMFWQAQRIYQRTNDPFWKATAAAIAAVLWMQCTVNFLSDLIETDKVGSVFYLCLAFLVIADAKTKEKTALNNSKPQTPNTKP